MKENTVVRGFVQGQAVEIVLDKGVSCILVHQDLVPLEKVDASQKLEVQCATLQNTPQPQLEISINGTTYEIRAGVLSTLPRYVLFIRDVETLLDLAVREANAFSVLS